MSNPSRTIIFWGHWNPLTHGIRLANNSFVAKKFHVSEMITRSVVDNAALNLRAATLQLAGMRVPPKVRTIRQVRRRVVVSFNCGPAQAIAIRHSVPKRDTSVQPIRQVQRA